MLLLDLSVFNNNSTFSCCEVLYSSDIRGHVSRVVNSSCKCFHTWNVGEKNVTGMFTVHKCAIQKCLSCSIYDQFIKNAPYGSNSLYFWLCVNKLTVTFSVWASALGWTHKHTTLGVLWLSVVVPEYCAKAEWGQLTYARLWAGFSAETVCSLVS